MEEYDATFELEGITDFFKKINDMRDEWGLEEITPPLRTALTIRDDKG